MNVLPNVPAVSVEDTAGTVSAPFKFNVPAPPDISITFDAATDPTKVIPELAFSVPVVITIFPTLAAVVLVPANVIRPATVAVPALIFHALVTDAVGWFIVTAPVTVNVVEDAWVNEVAVPPADSVKLLQLLSLFMVIAEPISIDKLGKVVLVVPPMVPVGAVNNIVLIPPE